MKANENSKARGSPVEDFAGKIAVITGGGTGMGSNSRDS